MNLKVKGISALQAFLGETRGQKKQLSPNFLKLCRSLHKEGDSHLHKHLWDTRNMLGANSILKQDLYNYTFKGFKEAMRGIWTRPWGTTGISFHRWKAEDRRERCSGKKEECRQRHGGTKEQDLLGSLDVRKQSQDSRQRTALPLRLSNLAGLATDSRLKDFSSPFNIVFSTFLFTNKYGFSMAFSSPRFNERVWDLFTSTNQTEVRELENLFRLEQVCLLTRVVFISLSGSSCSHEPDCQQTWAAPSCPHVSSSESLDVQEEGRAWKVT